jgi:hypothetical protein
MMTRRQAQGWLLVFAVGVWLWLWAITVRVAADPTQTPWQKWCASVDRSHLARWERQWLDRKPQRVATVFVTNYGPWEGFGGDTYHIASNVLPKGTVVWLSQDRCPKVVTNRGASSNDAWAQADHNPDGSPKQPAEFWVDRWTAKRRGDNGNQRAWIVGRAPWRH